MKYTITISAAEGGSDSKLFVGDLANSYKKLAQRNNWKCHVVKERPSGVGFQEITLSMDGDKSLSKLKQEAGGHRIQRVPPTEKRGRVHTSTVTVAVLGNDVKANPKYDMRDDKDFYVEWFSGTGKGGQKRNKSQSFCRLYHLPTGLMESRQGRSRDNNFNDAKISLIGQLDNARNGQVHSENSAIKKDQVGSGMRGDKVRTVRFQDDQATDHRTGNTTTAKKYMRGLMDELWD